MSHVLVLGRSYLAEIEEGKRNICLPNLKVIADGWERLSRDSFLDSHETC